MRPFDLDWYLDELLRGVTITVDDHGTMVATVAQFPKLRGVGPTEDTARAQLRRVVANDVQERRASGRILPPLGFMAGEREKG